MNVQRRGLSERSRRVGAKRKLAVARRPKLQIRRGGSEIRRRGSQIRTGGPSRRNRGWAGECADCVKTRSEQFAGLKSESVTVLVGPVLIAQMRRRVIFYRDRT